MIDYILIGLLVVVIILLLILIFKKSHNNDIVDRMSKLEIDLTKEIGDFKFSF